MPEQDVISDLWIKYIDPSWDVDNSCLPRPRDLLDSFSLSPRRIQQETLSEPILAIDNDREETGRILSRALATYSTIQDIELGVTGMQRGESGFIELNGTFVLMSVADSQIRLGRVLRRFGLTSIRIRLFIETWGREPPSAGRPARVP